MVGFDIVDVAVGASARAGIAYHGGDAAVVSLLSQGVLGLKAVLHARGIVLNVGVEEGVVGEIVAVSGAGRTVVVVALASYAFNIAIGAHSLVVGVGSVDV